MVEDVRPDPVAMTSAELRELMHACESAGQFECALEAFASYARGLISHGTAPADDLRAYAESLRERLAERASLERSLPLPTTSFVGRAAELAGLRVAFSAARHVSLVGAPGVGKSRLAVLGARVESRAAALRPVYVNLEGTRSDRFEETLVAALALEIGGGGDVRSAALRQLSAEPVLLLLDACESVHADAARFVDAALAETSGLRILSTSRRRLNCAAAVVELAPLGIDGANGDAVRLFVERAAATRGSFAPDARGRLAIRSICTRLDGVPLAIELAASRTALLSLEDLDRRLAAGADRPPMHEALERSVALLSDPQRRSFDRLGVFRDGWSLEGAEAVCASELEAGTTPLDLLAALRDSSLIVSEERDGSVRYRMLETIREFARERLAARSEDERAAHRCLAAHVLRIATDRAEATAGGEPAAFRALDGEFGNLIEALEFAASHPGEERAGIQTLTAARRYVLARGLAATAFRLADAMLASADPAHAASSWYAYGLRSAGSFANELGDVERSNALHARSRDAFRSAGDRAGESMALCSLAAAHYHAGDHARSERALHAALALLDRKGDEVGQFLVYKNLGAVGVACGGFERADAAFRAADALRRSVGAFELENLLTNRANLAFFTGAYADGVAFATEALELSRRHGYRRLDALEVLALNMAMTGQARASYAVFGEALDALAECESPPSLVHTIEDLVFCAARDRLDPVTLAELAGFTRRLRERIDLPTNPAWTPFFASARDMLEERLGAEFAEATARGERLSREEAIARARSSIELGMPDRTLPGLTARESEIAALVARGLRSSAVAEQLCVSRRTVDNHLAAMYRKLGLRSRAQLVTFVRDARRPDPTRVPHPTSR